MIVFIFFNDLFEKINLPNQISGMYPLKIKDNLLGNITGVNGTWKINLSKDYLSNDIVSDNNSLETFKCYSIYSNYDNANFILTSIPRYDENLKILEMFNAITVGNNSNCDIFYPYDGHTNNGNDILNISMVNNGRFTISTASSHFFNSNGNLKNISVCLSGDYILYYGLKIIFFGNWLIINQPGKYLTINTTNLNYRTFVNDGNTLSDYQKRKVEELPLFSKDEYFFKAPRLNYIVKEATIIVDEPPEPTPEDETPFILVIGPQLTMISTSVLTMISYLGYYVTGEGSNYRLIISLVTVGITVLGALLWPTITRILANKRRKKREALRQSKYSEYLEDKRRQINEIKDEQKTIIINNFPSADKCISIIDNKTKELWQRSIDHEDFLDIRLGIGRTYTKIRINIPEEKFTLEDEDSLLRKTKDIVKDSLFMEDVPVSYNFTDHSVNAIVGEETLVNSFLDCLFLEMLTFHSYTDLKIVVFSKHPERFDYLRIAPHCWDNQKNLRYFATTVEEFSIIANELEKKFDARIANSESEVVEDNGDENYFRKRFTNYRPYYLFFIDDIVTSRNVSLVSKILRYKQNVGFSIIMTSDSITTLPSEISDFIVVNENESAIMTSQINKDQRIFKADFNVNDAINIYSQVQKLANIPVMVEKEKYELPTSLSFLELYNLSRVEQLNSLERWTNNNPVLSLSVPIGIDQNGEVFKMDIHEKAFGPHGLVAGTTGSGKSEWIITYILSLAVNFSPEEVQFVLIDYKGGGLAMSFLNQELGIKLPHLVGTITNLDKSEIYRSIAAIDSELRRRQAIFNDVREKLKESSMNIYKYQELYRSGMVSEPLSHLLIICDEFAELKQQQSEFMEQLISTSRIGRSLGIHLILATQKPSGVVNDQIWSNSKFKVCLKVQDKSDSMEVLKRPDAAFLKQTGSFYLQVGNNDYYNLGQSAWCGAKYYPSDVLKVKIDESIVYIDNVGRAIRSFNTTKKDENQVAQGEELLNVVKYISELNDEKTFNIHPLWLPVIPTTVMISDLCKKYNRSKALAYTYKIAVGEFDDPANQRQGLLEIDLANGNVAVISNNMASSERFITTLLWSSIIEHTPYEIAHYVIDFGSESLRRFLKFPQVGEVILQDDTDSVINIISLIAEELENRKNLMADYNGSFTYYNQMNEHKLPLICLTINAYDVLTETYSKLSDIFTNLFRDAAKYGIVFVVSVTSQTALRQRQLQYFNHTIVMQMKDDSLYRNITNCRRGLIPKNVVGRGIVKINDSDANSYNEFQTAYIVSIEKETDTIKQFAEQLCDYYLYKVKQLIKVPDNVTSDDLVKYITDLSKVPFGYDLVGKNVTKYDLLKSKIHLFTGRNIKDYITFIYALTNILIKVPNVKVRVIDILNIFKLPELDIKLFNDDFDVLTASLERDCLTRKESQDYAVNIVIGMGSYKKRLTKAGAEIYDNLFSHVKDAKKTIYIMVDDYDKIRSLKLERWYNDLDKRGLWLGNGFGTQSLFKTTSLTNDDKKLNFVGLGYEVLDDAYKVIKVMMDGDE